MMFLTARWRQIYSIVALGMAPLVTVHAGIYGASFVAIQSGQAAVATKTYSDDPNGDASTWWSLVANMTTYTAPDDWVGVENPDTALLPWASHAVAYAATYCTPGWYTVVGEHGGNHKIHGDVQFTGTQAMFYSPDCSNHIDD